jgi:hypothetical protein
MLGEHRARRSLAARGCELNPRLGDALNERGCGRGTKERRHGWGIIRDAAPAQARPGRIVAAKPEAMLRIGGQQNVSPGRGNDGNAEAAAREDEPSSR